MQRLSGFLKLFKNKYFASIAAFIIWISFFDRNDLLMQWDRKQELQRLEASKEYYEAEIEHTKKDLTQLNNDPAILEKFARENFFLKRPNEEIFIITDSVKEKINF